ncbi:uncharacterized protein BJX67DRAFT_36888 [Aspergillus lucknowensis]|uniref:Uncharacterized protein n=1 Tax=Aspergillus lucknowensis TaxID=176173 RepID=A0ABR4LZG8_9EURO
MRTNYKRECIIIDYRFLASWVNHPARRRKRSPSFSPVDYTSKFSRCMAILLRRLSWHYLAPRTISSSNSKLYSPTPLI